MTPAQVLLVEDDLLILRTLAQGLSQAKKGVRRKKGSDPNGTDLSPSAGS
jgi:DNA-binding response OmpR family regulator